MVHVRDETDHWYYPVEMSEDFQGTGVPPERIPEALAMSWEYNRCVIPEFTNWDRYIALARLVGIAVVAEYDGNLVDILADGPVLGFDLDEQLELLFGSGAILDEMAREYRSSLLFMTEKSSQRRGSALFRRYADSLARDPADYLRIRDCDGLFRFYLAASIACNDSENWLTESENRCLGEMAVLLYDAAAFHKHRAEGEICNAFAYADPELRSMTYRINREILWALEPTWAKMPDRRCALSFVRFVGGPIHIATRRYRYVEDDLMVGRPETAEVVDQTRRNAKLWYRNDPKSGGTEPERYEQVMRWGGRILFPGFADMLTRDENERCSACQRHSFYGTSELSSFSGVELCEGCRKNWGEYLLCMRDRAGEVLPLSPPPDEPTGER